MRATPHGFGCALTLGVLAVASGLALWKPVQLHALTAAFGGYDVARRVHFAVMVGIVGFILLHLMLVLMVPRTLPGMITGRIRCPPRVSHPDETRGTDSAERSSFGLAAS